MLMSWKWLLLIGRAFIPTSVTQATKAENGQCCACDLDGGELKRNNGCLVFDPDSGKPMHEKEAWRNSHVQERCSGGMYTVLVDAGISILKAGAYAEF
jgi:hypothetical protein